MWHVSSRSGVATLRTAIHLSLTYLLLTYITKLLTGLKIEVKRCALGRTAKTECRVRVTATCSGCSIHHISSGCSVHAISSHAAGSLVHPTATMAVCNSGSCLVHVTVCGEVKRERSAIGLIAHCCPITVKSRSIWSHWWWQCRDASPVEGWLALVEKWRRFYVDLWSVSLRLWPQKQRKQRLGNNSLHTLNALPSVLWHCWLGGRKGIRPVKNWVVGCWRGYLSGARCRLAYGPDDATATHCLLLH